MHSVCALYILVSSFVLVPSFLCPLTDVKHSSKLLTLSAKLHTPWPRQTRQQAGTLRSTTSTTTSPTSRILMSVDDLLSRRSTRRRSAGTMFALFLLPELVSCK